VSSEFRGEWRDNWYVVPHHVLFRDLDPFGHVNNAVFLTYFEWARTLLWFDITGRRGARDIGFIVARTECDFIRQLDFEPIEICTRVGEIRNTSFDFVYELRKSEGGELAAKGRVVVVLYDWARQSKKEIDEELRRKLIACSAERS
jgi:acyl-CoA thioester hydrolase